ncbi:phage protein [Streptococcus pneumoniae]|nr:phage protein [Streptococcus pneumoniae]
MNKDLIETPRFNFFIGDEVLLKGKIVGFDVDENKCVENVVRLEYGQTLNVPNNNIYITDDIVDKSKIKVVVPQFVADWIEVCKEHLTTSLYTAMTPNFMKENNQSFDLILWIKKASNQDLFARAWLDGYEVEKEKRYLVKIKGNIKENMLGYGELLKRYFFTKSFSLDDVIYSHTRKELENAKIGWGFDCEGFEIEEVE